jgi:hypothetical protein
MTNVFVVRAKDNCWSFDSAPDDSAFQDDSALMKRTVER